MISDLYFLLSVIVSAWASYAITGNLGVWTLLIFIGMSVVGYFVLVALHLAVCFVMCLFADSSEPCMRRRPAYRRAAAWTASLVMGLLRTRTHISGEELPEGRFFIVSNHISNVDPIICIDKFREHEIAFISKPENFRIPVVGRLIHHCNFLPIDRENARNAMRTINTAAELMMNDVCSFGVYPEGTRSRTGKLGEFHDGVFRAATKAQVPIVVATVRGTNEITHRFPFRSTDVYFNIERVIAPEEYKEMNYHEIGSQVRTIILESLGQTE